MLRNDLLKGALNAFVNAMQDRMIGHLQTSVSYSKDAFSSIFIY